MRNFITGSAIGTIDYNNFPWIIVIFPLILIFAYVIVHKINLGRKKNL